MKKRLLILAVILVSTTIFSQEVIEQQQSNIQTYTPSKLLSKGQLDIKWFNNFYSETESTFSDASFPRANFYTATFETFYGTSENARFNIGLVFNVKSNNIGGDSWFSPLNFNNEDGVARAGLTSIAPSVSFQPVESVGNFSIRSSFFFPLIENETENGVYLDKKSYVWETKFFYDYTFASNKLQLFTEIDTQLNIGEQDEGFANNSLGLPVSAFISYFPTNNSTVYLQTQQYFLIDLGNNFSQEYTQLGLGAKYQITQTLNLEASYTNFVRGTDTGLGETINFGLRYISKK